MGLQYYRLFGYAGSHLSLMLYLLHFLPQRFKRSKAAVCCALVFACLVALDWLQFIRLDASKVNIGLLFTLAQTAIVQLFAVYLSKYRDMRAVFTGVNAATYVLTGSVLGTVVLTLTDDTALSILASNCVNLLLCFVMIRKVSSAYRRTLEQSDLNWGGLCLLPALIYATVYALTVYPTSIYERRDNILAAALMIVTTLAIHIVLFGYLGQRLREGDTERQNAVLASYSKGLETQIKLISERNDEIRVLRHDMRHYLNVFSVLLEQGEYDEIRKLLFALNAEVDKSGAEQFCENTVINGVLLSRLSALEGTGVEVSVRANLPQDLSVDSFEFAAALSNLIENAVEAAARCAEGNRTLSICVAQSSKHGIIVEIVNSYEGGLALDAETGMPVSSKGEGHGYGLESVRAFTRKNNSVFDCYAEDGKFTARLLIQ